MPDFSLAHHNPRDEGPLCPSQPSHHSFVVVVDREGEETWIVDPLPLQLAQDLAVSCQREGFVVHSVEGMDTAGGTEAKPRVRGGQSRHLLHVQPHGPLDDSRTQRPLRQQQVHDGASQGKTNVPLWNGCKNGAKSK